MIFNNGGNLVMRLYVRSQVSYKFILFTLNMKGIEIVFFIHVLNGGVIVKATNQWRVMIQTAFLRY